jgi:pimeloyl-ACP methyl ester carboxylesterase
MLDGVKRRLLRLPERGVDIALLDWGGEGPVALLHHANGFCAGVWGLVAEGLRSRFRVIAMDARGHGDSSAPPPPEPYHWENFARDAASVALALRDESGQARIALGIGHSFGGTSLLGASAAHPDLFERLLLLDPVVPPSTRVIRTALQRAHVGSLVEVARKRRHVWPDRDTARARWADKEMFAGWDPRAFELYLSEGMRDRDDGQVELKCRGDVEASVFEQGGTADVLEWARGVRIPVEILWASRGDFPRSIHEHLAEQMPHAVLHDVDTGHFVPMERPDLVIEAALNF